MADIKDVADMLSNDDTFSIEGEFEKRYTDELMDLPEDEFKLRCHVILQNSRDCIDWIRNDKHVQECFDEFVGYMRTLTRETCRMNALTAVMAMRAFNKTKLASA